MILVDLLCLHEVETGNDGDEDIFGIIFLEVYVSSSSCFWNSLKFEVGATRLRG